MDNKLTRMFNKLGISEHQAQISPIPLDVSNANRLFLPKLQFIKREIPIQEHPLSQEFEIQSDFIEFIITERKPKGFKLPKCEGESLITLIRRSSFLPRDLPYLYFNSSKIEYRILEQIPELSHDIYGFKDTPNRNAFIANSKDLVLYVYDWNLTLLHKMDVSQYSSEHTHLRNVDMSSDLSYFLFTSANKAYLLNSSFRIVSSWKMPNKAGYEKVSDKHENIFAKLRYQEYLSKLELKRNPTPEETKSSFRRLALKYHPDKNPDDPFATSKMIDIIEAYEQLTSEDAKKAFEKTVDYEYWINTINAIKLNIGGISVQVSYSLGETGEDWIYGSGISPDASRIYLGCYSGKIYEINRNGGAMKIYIVPEDKEGHYGQTNPSTNVVERGDYLHIVSYWYLYILKDNRVVSYFPMSERDIKWFDHGFLFGYSGETGHSFRFKTATDRSEATLDGHYTSLWPE